MIHLGTSFEPIILEPALFECSCEKEYRIQSVNWPPILCQKGEMSRDSLFVHPRSYTRLRTGSQVPYKWLHCPWLSELLLLTPQQ